MNKSHGERGTWIGIMLHTQQRLLAIPGAL